MKDVEGALQLGAAPNDGAVVEEEGEEAKVGAVLLDANEKGLEDEGEEERGKGISLLGAG